MHSGSQANEFDFAGQQTDASTGLQYLRARYMDTNTGTFISRDPLAGSPTWLDSHFGYAGANPVNATDPTGTQEQWDEARGVWYDDVDGSVWDEALQKWSTADGSQVWTLASGWAPRSIIGTGNAVAAEAPCEWDNLGCGGKWEIVDTYTYNYDTKETGWDVGAGVTLPIFYGVGPSATVQGWETRSLRLTLRSRQDSTLFATIEERQVRALFGVGVGVGWGKFGFGYTPVDIKSGWVGYSFEDSYWRVE